MSELYRRYGISNQKDGMLTEFYRTLCTYQTLLQEEKLTPELAQALYALEQLSAGTIPPHRLEFLEKCCVQSLEIIKQHLSLAFEAQQHFMEEAPSTSPVLEEKQQSYANVLRSVNDILAKLSSQDSGQDEQPLRATG